MYVLVTVVDFILCEFKQEPGCRGNILSVGITNFVLACFLTGLRDPIARSIVGGGVPTQNSGYNSTRT